MDEPVVLLEDFLNRHRNPNFNPIKFPHKIVPILFLVGVAVFVFAWLAVLPLYFLRINPQIFNPKLLLLLVLAGGGLQFACLAVGAIWGLIKEKKTGYKRKNYESLMLLYLFLFFLGMPFPSLIFGKFFYHYPFVRYPAYEIELKPTPELEREIDRFMWAKIKWHTPYDYSLDRQTIRYEVLEPRDTKEIINLKKFVFINYGSKHNKIKSYYEPPVEILKFQEDIHPDSDHLPTVIEHNGLVYCAVAISYYDSSKYFKSLSFKSAINGHPKIELIPITKKDSNSIYYNLNAIFEVKHFSHQNTFCDRRRDLKNNKNKALLQFWIKTLMIPKAYNNAYKFWWYDQHVMLDFSFSSFLAALDELS